MKTPLLTPQIRLIAASILTVSFQTAALGGDLHVDPRTTVTATMDGGIGKANNTWYEVGVNSAAPTTGLKTGLVISQTDAQSSYIFQPATSLNAFMLDTGRRTGTITFQTPTAVHGLSLAGASGQWRWRAYDDARICQRHDNHSGAGYGRGLVRQFAHHSDGEWPD